MVLNCEKWKAVQFDILLGHGSLVIVGHLLPYAAWPALARTATLMAALPLRLGALSSAKSAVGVFFISPPRVSMQTYWSPVTLPLSGSTAAMRVSLSAEGSTCPHPRTRIKR
jgi:hypothetical protein